jgi:hypothetical protein
MPPPPVIDMLNVPHLSVHSTGSHVSFVHVDCFEHFPAIA